MPIAPGFRSLVPRVEPVTKDMPNRYPFSACKWEKNLHKGVVGGLVSFRTLEMVGDLSKHPKIMPFFAMAGPYGLNPTKHLLGHMKKTRLARVVPSEEQPETNMTPELIGIVFPSNPFEANRALNLIQDSHAFGPRNPAGLGRQPHGCPTVCRAKVGCVFFFFPSESIYL